MLLSMLGLLLWQTSPLEATKSYKNVSRSQHGEDLFLYETFFYGRLGGVILESGALDGMRFSNSYMFETTYNWQAIHIEGDLKNFQELQRNRPKSINLNAALCETKQTVHYLSHMGGAVSGIRELLPEDVLDWRYRNPKIYNVTEIDCIPMKDVMANLNVKRVDIWTLDVTGGELSVLMGVNFSSFRPDVIMVKTPAFAFKVEPVIYLQKKGYVCFQIPFSKKMKGAIRNRNHACARKDFMPSTAPGRKSCVELTRSISDE